MELQASASPLQTVWELPDLCDSVSLPRCCQIQATYIRLSAAFVLTAGYLMDSTLAHSGSSTKTTI